MVERKLVEFEESDAARKIFEKIAWAWFEDAQKHGFPSEEGVSGFIDTKEGKVKLHYGHYPHESGLLHQRFTVEFGDTKVKFNVQKMKLLPCEGSEAEVDKALEILRSLDRDNIVFVRKENDDNQN